MRKKRSSSPVISGKVLPQRTCVACGVERTKRELIRLVRTADGTAEVDPGGKRPGRGVYLCPNRECWRAGLGGKRLEHALRTTLTPENRRQLAAYGESLGEDNSGAKGAYSWQIVN